MEDTYKGAVDNPLSLNRYTYVHNSPLNNIDPSGNYCISSDGNNAHSGGCSNNLNKVAGYIDDSKASGLPVIEKGTITGYIGQYGPFKPVETTYFDRSSYVSKVLEIKMGGSLAPGIGLASAARNAASSVLRSNMIKAGVQEPEFANAAHHIVGFEAKLADGARKILDKFKIGYNDAANGVFLPTVKNVSESIYHRGVHTNKYYQEVERRINEATSKEEALEILEDISDMLRKGTFPY